MAKALTPLMGLILIAALAWAAIALMAAPPFAQSVERAVSAVQANPVVPFQPVPNKIGESLSDALAHHEAAEVMRVRNCFHKGGADMIFRQTLGDRIRFHLLCQEEDGTWADRIIEKVNGAWEEVTAFEPKNSTKVLQQVLDWLARKGAARVKALPW